MASRLNSHAEKDINSLQLLSLYETVLAHPPGMGTNTNDPPDCWDDNRPRQTPTRNLQTQTSASVDTQHSDRVSCQHSNATFGLSLLPASQRRHATLKPSLLPAFRRRHATLGLSLLPAPRRDTTLRLSLLPAFPHRHATLELSAYLWRLSPSGFAETPFTSFHRAVVSSFSASPSGSSLQTSFFCPLFTAVHESVPALQHFVPRSYGIIQRRHATLGLGLLPASKRRHATLKLSLLPVSRRRHATLKLSLLPASRRRHATLGSSLLPAPRRHTNLEFSLLPAPLRAQEHRESDPWYLTATHVFKNTSGTNANSSFCFGCDLRHWRRGACRSDYNTAIARLSVA